MSVNRLIVVGITLNVCNLGKPIHFCNPQPCAFVYSFKLISFFFGSLKKLFCKYYRNFCVIVQGFGCISGFIITMFVAYLFVKKRLTAAMSSYHIFRKTLIEIGELDKVMVIWHFYVFIFIDH
jgi:hypothetical protein